MNARYSVTTGIIDNDPKGKTGRGTVYRMIVERAGQVIETHEWGLLEQLAGLFGPRNVSKKYTELNRTLDEAADREAEEKKKAHKLARVASVEEDPAIMALLAQAISTETKAIEQFKSGKEKALNAVVGKIIGECKKQNIQADAFKITTLLKKKLTEIT